MRIWTDGILAQRLELAMNATGSSSEKGEASASQANANATRSIRSARELFESLRAADIPTRLSSLKAVQAQPQAAVGFGTWQELDLIDVLLTQASKFEGTLEWLDWIGALAHFRDERVTQFFLRVLAQEDEPRLLFCAAQYLAGASLAPLSRALRPMLLRNDNPVRAHAVAGLLRAQVAGEPAVQLRVALLAENCAWQVPDFNPSTADIWLAELAGPFRTEARNALRMQGELTWVALARFWGNLRAQEQVWVLQWGIDEFPGMVGALVPQSLASEHAEVRLEALRVLGALGEKQADASIRELAAEFLNDRSAIVRAAAAHASPPAFDWRAFLDRETDLQVRAAAITQLAKQEGQNALPTLIQFLGSDDWHLRAAAADAIAGMGARSAELMKPLVHDGDENVRIAAVRVLLNLAEDEWLKHELGLTT
jgi:HEAT repeat protein